MHGHIPEDLMPLLARVGPWLDKWIPTVGGRAIGRIVVGWGERAVEGSASASIETALKEWSAFPDSVRLPVSQWWTRQMRSTGHRTLAREVRSALGPNVLKARGPIGPLDGGPTPAPVAVKSSETTAAAAVTPVQFRSSEGLDVGALFLARHSGGAHTVLLNTAHPGYAAVARALNGAERTIFLQLLESWAIMELEQPEGRRRTAVAEVREEWGRVFARRLRQSEP